MQWDEALASIHSIGVRSVLAAHDQSYRHLSAGPVHLAEWERTLRRTVSHAPTGSELPIRLRCDLFAWTLTVTMAHRRLVWDLPAAWFDVDSGPN